MEICKKFLDGLLETKWRQVFPIGANRGPVSPDVPPEIAKDYVEACNVLPISPKASVALGAVLSAEQELNGHAVKQLCGTAERANQE